MKNLLIFLIVLLFAVSCTKDKGTTPTPTATVTSTATAIGLVWDKVYKFTNSVRPSSGDQTIIFHADSTITEILLGDTATYAAYPIASSIGSASVLQNGQSIKFCIPKDTALEKRRGHSADFFYGNARSCNDSAATLGVFLSGAIVQDSKPTFGASFTNGNYSVIY